MPLPVRNIGGSPVTAIGIGLWGLSGAYRSEAIDDETRFAFLDSLIEKGCTFLDTADMYDDSEDLLGKWFKRTGKRNEVFLATKFGFSYFVDSNRFLNGEPEYVKSAFERSISRLGVDYIDLYYLHRADPTVPIEKTVGAMAELVKAGKVKHLGLSEVSAATLRRAHAVHPIAAVQVEYSPFCLDIEDEQIGLLKACRELGITVVAYSPLGRGMLAGQIKSYNDIPADDWRKTIPRFSQENFPNILKITDGLTEIGKRHNATPGQIALAWLLAEGEDIIPIPGTTKVKYLEENLGALDIKLTPAEQKEVRDVSENADASHGDRYPANFIEVLYADTPPL